VREVLSVDGSSRPSAARTLTSVSSVSGERLRILLLVETARLFGDLAVRFDSSGRKPSPSPTVPWPASLVVLAGGIPRETEFSQWWSSRQLRGVPVNRGRGSSPQPWSTFPGCDV